MHPHHRPSDDKLTMAFRDGESSVALELSQAQDGIRRRASGHAQSTGSAAVRASSQSSSGRSSSGEANHCLAEAEVTGRHRITAGLQVRRSG